MYDKFCVEGGLGWQSITIQNHHGGIGAKMRRRAPFNELASALFVIESSHAKLWKSFVPEEKKLDISLWHQFPEYCCKKEAE